MIRRAFTLIEIMVVIIIASVVLSMGIPMFQKMRELGDVEAAVGSVTGACKLARALAIRAVPDVTSINPACNYSGVALIFTPMGEIRIAENDQTARAANAITWGAYTSSVDQLIETIRMPQNCDGTNANNDAMNGYTDIPGMDYIKMPQGAGFAGIERNMPDQLLLLQPPFAIQFTDDGTMIGSSRDTHGGRPRWVHYDGNFDGRIICDLNYQNHYIENGCPGPYPAWVIGATRDRPFGTAPVFPTLANYDPDLWSPSSNRYVAHNDTTSLSGVHPGTLRYKLPFEQIETCLGIMIYSKREFQDAGGDWTGTRIPAGYASCNDWVYQNGKAVFFNRFSGSAIRGAGRAN